MNIIELIEKKKNKEQLSSDEINYFVSGVTDGSIPDYQISALLMAICINGMSYEETHDLTMAMAYSGDTLKPSINGETVLDKHSTGGVGDKTTLIVGPIMESLGIRVGKMSGRGLGITGGTVDKLESIPGFNSNVSEDQFKVILEKVGFVDAAQTRALAPADKKLYALRDVTATVESIPLIASSIMSKKIASGADAIVLDVKYGSGAFMKDIVKAEELAETMINIGKLAGRKCTAVLSDMNSPLGYSVGNILEVQEAVRFLKGVYRDERLYELIITLCSEMYMLSDMYTEAERNPDLARQIIIDVLETDLPYNKFLDFVDIQGGDVGFIEQLCIEDTDISNVYTGDDSESELNKEFKADKDGVLTAIDAESIGRAAMCLGAGRIKLEDEIDPFAGVVLLKKLGEPVSKGETLAVFYTKNNELFNDAWKYLDKAFSIQDSKDITADGIVRNILFV